MQNLALVLGGFFEGGAVDARGREAYVVNQRDLMLVTYIRHLFIKLVWRAHPRYIRVSSRVGPPRCGISIEHRSTR